MCSWLLHSQTLPAGKVRDDPPIRAVSSITAVLALLVTPRTLHRCLRVQATARASLWFPCLHVVRAEGPRWFLSPWLSGCPSTVCSLLVCLVAWVWLSTVLSPLSGLRTLGTPQAHRHAGSFLDAPLCFAGLSVYPNARTTLSLFCKIFIKLQLASSMGLVAGMCHSYSAFTNLKK